MEDRGYGRVRLWKREAVDAIWAIEEEGNRRGRLLKREATLS
jgi:hypothetical protein